MEYLHTTKLNESLFDKLFCWADQVSLESTNRMGRHINEVQVQVNHLLVVGNDLGTPQCYQGSKRLLQLD